MVVSVGLVCLPLLCWVGGLVSGVCLFGLAGFWSSVRFRFGVSVFFVSWASPGASLRGLRVDLVLLVSGGYLGFGVLLFTWFPC